jgi:hypothetical protein
VTLSPLRPLAAGAVLAALAALLAGCGDDAPSAATSGDDSRPALDAAGGPTGARGGMPGTFGEIAAVDGDVLQVQNRMTGQVAVTVTGDTTVTAQVAATEADVATGMCVMVRGASADASDTAADDADETPTERRAELPTEVAAASVAVSPAADGDCTGGAGGGPARGPARTDGRPTDLPTDLPSDRLGGMPGGVRAGFGFAGRVSSVTEGGFVVDGPQGSITVTVGADTTYTKQAPAEVGDLTVGRCVRVEGEADNTGAVTAASVQVSDRVNDECGL